MALLIQLNHRVNLDRGDGLGRFYWRFGFIWGVVGWGWFSMVLNHHLLSELHLQPYHVMVGRLVIECYLFSYISSQYNLFFKFAAQI